MCPSVSIIAVTVFMKLAFTMCHVLILRKTLPVCLACRFVSNEGNIAPHNAGAWLRSLDTSSHLSNRSVVSPESFQMPFDAIQQVAAQKIKPAWRNCH